MKMRKVFFTIIIALLVLLIRTESKAASESGTEIKLIPTVETIEAGTEIPVEIYVKNPNKNIIGVDTLIEFNEDIFEAIDENNFTPNIDMEIFSYESDVKNLQMIFSNPIEEGVVATIRLMPKVTIEESEENINLLRMYDMCIVAEDYTEEEIEELNSSIWGLGERLYLSTEAYKIGDNDTENYVEGDKYISRIVKETKFSDFKQNLDTNADEIKIIKKDESELEENEFVGTGMKLVLIKGNKTIEIVLAVEGDLSGDGMVTITDLSALNQTILETVELNEVESIAADLDENQEITITDLSTLNKMLLGTV